MFSVNFHFTVNPPKKTRFSFVMNVVIFIKLTSILTHFMFYLLNMKEIRQNLG